MKDIMATSRIISALETLAKTYQRQVTGFRAKKFETAANAIQEELDYTMRIIRSLERGTLVVDHPADLAEWEPQTNDTPPSKTPQASAAVSPSTLKNK